MKTDTVGTQRRVRLSTGVIVSAVVSVLAHLVVFGLLFLFAPESSVSPTREKVKLNIVDRVPRSVLEKAPLVNGPDEERRIRDDTPAGQVVDLPEPEEQRVPDQARFLSRYDIKVDREQVARRAPGSPGSPGDKPARRQKGIVVADETDSGGEGDRPSDQKSSPREEEPVTKKGGLKGLNSLLLPGGAGGGRAGALNMRMLADEVVADDAGTGGRRGNGGAGGSSDVFMGVEDEGSETLVNSRSFKYWDFFDRIKSQVRSEWDPGTVYRSRDPYGKVFGQKDRYTILAVVLDSSGAISQMEVVHPSGLEFLDEEAMRAFQAAAPFPNPPGGLIDNTGRIVFRFGFLLEFGSSTGSFFWQRP